MSSEFYKYFFKSQYQEALECSTSSDDLNELDTSHVKLAQVLLQSNFTHHDIQSLDIKPSILELEALRQEIGFAYGRALEIRYAIASSADSILNRLSILDIQLKSKSIDECNLGIFDNLDIDLVRNCPLCHKRIINILEFISDNGGHIILPQSLVKLVKNLFEAQYRQKSSLTSAQNLVKVYYHLQEYESALEILTAIRDKIPFNEDLSYYFIRTYLRLCNLYEALEFNQLYIENYPFSIKTNYSYGMIINSFGKTQEAGEHFNFALSQLLSYVKSKVGLHNSYRRFYSYRISTTICYQIISTVPIYNQLCYSIAEILDPSEHLASINSLCKQSVISIPNSCYSILAMGFLSQKKGDSELATLKSAREIVPYSWYVAEKILTLTKSKDMSSKERICLQFINSSNEYYKYLAMICLVSVYLYHGFLIEVYQILDEFQEALFKVKNIYFDTQQVVAIYFGLCFVIPSVRDSVLFNSLIFTTLSEKFQKLFSNWKLCIQKIYKVNFSSRKCKKLKPTRIGFVSPNFRGHVVSLLSIDVIKEMSLIPDLEVMMIVTGKNCKDHPFLQGAKKIESLQVIELYEHLAEQVVSISNLGLDVLIDLDGITEFSGCMILGCQPAIVNCSWLGFDAPYISDQNYFLCDWYTHPEGVDEFYIEKLVRLPHSHMCVAEFKVSDRDIGEARSELGISDDQIVFIYPSGVRKFNFDSAMAHAQILSRVPNSVLVVKAYSGTPKLVEIWHEEFAKVGVDPSRLKLAPNIPDPEQHRLLLKMSDVYLDAYPYNGGSISLEAVWCNLPIVTYCGEQSFARMGYSLLSTAGITEGIAHSWEEYIEWAVRLGTDRDLRLSIKERLAKGKDPDHLCPLWNPKQFARDMYNILQELYEQAEV
jgi:protein O-GlcNAc transferase